MTYDVYQVETAPSWMQRAWGRAFNFVLGSFKTGFVEAAKVAVKVRFAETAPTDAITSLLRDYQLLPPYNEPLARTRARLTRAWATHKRKGKKSGLVAELNDAGYTNVVLFERPTSRWWEFSVVAQPPFPWDHAIYPILKIGGGWTIGNGVLRDLGPVGERDRVIAIINDVKPAHEQLLKFTVVIDGPIIGQFTVGDGTVVGGTYTEWR